MEICFCWFWRRSFPSMPTTVSMYEYGTSRAASGLSFFHHVMHQYPYSYVLRTSILQIGGPCQPGIQNSARFKHLMHHEA